LLVWARLVFAGFTAVLALAAFGWHMMRRRRFKFDRRAVQASRRLAGLGWIGTAYFGWILGTTLFTEMATPTVLVLAAVGTVAGVKFGLAAGVGLGMARSFDPWRGAFEGHKAPSVIVNRYIARSRTITFRLTGVTVSTFLFLINVVLAARLM
jgi:hypothetical protein